MCPSLTWGTCSVHYLLGLPLVYAPHSATPNGWFFFNCPGPSTTVRELLRHFRRKVREIHRLPYPPHRPHGYSGHHLCPPGPSCLLPAGGKTWGKRAIPLSCRTAQGGGRPGTKRIPRGLAHGAMRDHIRSSAHTPVSQAYGHRRNSLSAMLCLAARQRKPDQCRVLP